MTTAVEVLRQHNRWRRGEDIPQQDPKRIGEAIDSVCNQVETCASQCEATACRIELQRLRALVQRLARALLKAAPDNDLPGKALDYLRRKNLQSSPLRDADSAPNAT